MKGARHRMRATARTRARHSSEGARPALTPPQPRFVLRPPRTSVNARRQVNFVDAWRLQPSFYYGSHEQGTHEAASMSLSVKKHYISRVIPSA